MPGRTSSCSSNPEPAFRGRPGAEFRRALGLLAFLVLPASRLAAQQTIAGTLLRSIDSLPIAGALVTLADSSGHDIARTASDERGRFFFPVRLPGTYRLQVLRIGLKPAAPRAVLLAPGGRADLRLYLAEVPVRLPEIIVAAERRRCGAPPDSSALGEFLAEARKALALTEISMERRTRLFQTSTWIRVTRPDLTTIDSMPTVQPALGWPIQSAPPDSLRAWGFVHEEPDSSGALAPAYYGPDARVLFAEWFLDAHCLRASAREGGQVAVEFTPARTGARIDIAGSFVFDSATFALRELDWRWIGQGTWVRPDYAGGYIRFRRLETGEWLPVAWLMRAPAPQIVPGAGLKLARYVEKGGVVERLLTR